MTVAQKLRNKKEMAIDLAFQQLRTQHTQNDQQVYIYFCQKDSQKNMEIA